MKKTSIGSDNRLSYQDNYEEIIRYKRGSNKSRITNNTRMNNKSDEGSEFILSRGTRWFLFFFFVFLQILMNIDHGTFPAATEEIKKDLNILDHELGLFGSLVFLGITIGIFF
jgi:preprotein translocase subunit SecG